MGISFYYFAFQSSTLTGPDILLDKSTGEQFFCFANQLSEFWKEYNNFPGSFQYWFQFENQSHLCCINQFEDQYVIIVIIYQGRSRQIYMSGWVSKHWRIEASIWSPVSIDRQKPLFTYSLYSMKQIVSNRSNCYPLWSVLCSL